MAKTDDTTEGTPGQRAAPDVLTQPRRRNSDPHRRPLSRPAGHTVTLKRYQTVQPEPGAIAAAVAIAKLDTQADAEILLSALPLHASAKRPPTLEQLRYARAMMHALEAAIVVGDDSQNWELIHRAGEVLRLSMTDRRRAVLAVLHELCERASSDADKAPDNVEPEFDVQIAIAELETIGRRFATVDASRVTRLVRQRKPRMGAVGIAVTLCLESGALDASRQRRESIADATKRVRRSFEKVREKQRAHAPK